MFRQLHGDIPFIGTSPLHNFFKVLPPFWQIFLHNLNKAKFLEFLLCSCIQITPWYYHAQCGKLNLVNGRLYFLLKILSFLSALAMVHYEWSVLLHLVCWAWPDQWNLEGNDRGPFLSHVLKQVAIHISQAFLIHHGIKNLPYNQCKIKCLLLEATEIWGLFSIQQYCSKG